MNIMNKMVFYRQLKNGVDVDFIPVFKFLKTDGKSVTRVFLKSEKVDFGTSRRSTLFG